MPYNTVITAPTPPTRIGYTFGGWYKEAGLTNPWNFETDTVTKDTELYAKWDACFTSNPTNPKKSSSGKRKTAPPQPAQVSVIVIVNGEEHDAGIETKTTEDEKSTVIIELNNQVIKSVIDETTKDNFTGTGSVIQIPITDASSQVAKVERPVTLSRSWKKTHLMFLSNGIMWSILFQLKNLLSAMWRKSWCS